MQKTLVQISYWVLVAFSIACSCPNEAKECAIKCDAGTPEETGTETATESDTIIEAASDTGGYALDHVCDLSTCTSPPPSHCASSGSLFIYLTPGICGEDGLCAYTQKEILCLEGCEDGACRTAQDGPVDGGLGGGEYAAVDGSVSAG